MSSSSKVIHLFHWPSIPEYQEKALQMIALPTGARGQIYYGEKWVDENTIKEIKSGSDAMFWVLGCSRIKEKGSDVNKFDFACPIRLLKILNEVEKDPSTSRYKIDFTAQEFITPLKKISNAKALQEYTEVDFKDAQMPGREKGYVHIGPRIKLEKSQEVPLEQLYKVLEDIPCNPDYKAGTTIKDYPLLRISLKGSKLNEGGMYELSTNREYEISFSYHQGDDKRYRIVTINGRRFSGKERTEKVPAEGIRRNAKKLDIRVECDNLGFEVPLDVQVTTPLYESRLASVTFMIIISAISVFIYISLFPGSNIDTKNALLFPLIVLILSAVWEALTKKDAKT